MAILGDPQHFQTVRTTARTAFELFLDIDQLAKDPSLADKIFAFTMVSKYDSAKKLINALDKHHGLDPQRYRHQRALVNDASERKEFEDLIDKYWPPKDGKRKAPNHWSGKDIASRAIEAGIEFEMMYRHEYTVNCSLTHSGIVFIDGMPPEFFVNAFGLGHVNFQKLLLKASAVIAETFHLFIVKPSLKRQLHELGGGPK